jgi:hypothetical protein
MVSRAEFEETLVSESAQEDRIVIFGALLAKTTGLCGSLVIVGGSAISVYTSGPYVSEGIDFVGRRARITPTLARWGFRLDKKGSRPYWVRDDLGLVVDLVGRTRYAGLESHVRTFQTTYGPVRVAAPEDLVIRRLIFAKMEGREEYLNQAALVFEQAGAGIDFGYLEALVRYEGVEDAYRELRARARPN